MNQTDGFALWLTGLPASGKSSIAGELVKKLRTMNVPVVVLESDEMRRILTPEPDYSEPERDRFYSQLALIGAAIIKSGVNVIFDATGNKQAYRDYARRLIEKYLEVYVRCPLEVCIRRDPKRIYASAAQQKAGKVPGVQAPYEPPREPEVILDGQAPPGQSAGTILDKLKQFLYI